MDLFDFTPAPEPAPAARLRKAPAKEAEGREPEAETVSQVTRRIRDLLERGVGPVQVEGEISNHRKQTSGHHYFTLKDAGAQLACVLFKGNAAGSGGFLRDGMAVRVAGEISVYESRGQYQMIVRQVRPAGAGALQAQFEALKRRLLAEGLFEQDRKKPIPRFPLTVALVTSPTGAVLQDMLNVLRRRSPWLRVLVYPVRVQGPGAAAEVAAALEALGNWPADHARIDTIVVARGGGSLEDLWAFNEEVVAWAIADCPVPVLSAVGHETDFTIADFTADLRAPTPSAAAELLAPDAGELRVSLLQHRTSLIRRVQQALSVWRRELELMGRGPLGRDRDRVLLPWRQRLDEVSHGLRQATELALQKRRQQCLTIGYQMERVRPDRILAQRNAALGLMREKLLSRMQTVLASRVHQVDQVRRQLRALGPGAVLARGFSYTLNSAGEVVRKATSLQPGDSFTTHLAEGRIEGVVRSAVPPSDPPES